MGTPQIGLLQKNAPVFALCVFSFLCRFSFFVCRPTVGQEEWGRGDCQKLSGVGVREPRSFRRGWGRAWPNEPTPKKRMGDTSVHSSPGQGVLRVLAKSSSLRTSIGRSSQSSSTDIKHMVEADGAEQLKRACLRIVPDETVGKTTQACLTESQRLLSSALFSWVGEVTQIELKAAEAGAVAC